MSTSISDGAAPRPILDIASGLGLDKTSIEPLGWHKAKFALGYEKIASARPQGHYVGVTAITPTPLGEGKTVNTIGLAMGLSQLGHKAICTLREPSLAPVFGIKGGGAGGGKSRLLPHDEINLHFTGDLHAITSANNLLAAMIDNHLKRQLEPRIVPETVTWRRVLDISDKGLTGIVTGLGNVPQAPLRETAFDLTAASEVMAILALAGDLNDLRQRIGRILVGLTPDGQPVTADDIGAAGAMTALMRDAVRPNLVQTCEHTPAIVHAGPFANIAHGNSSILADRLGLGLADYVVTESGFGSDCGAEKFFHIKCRVSGLSPAVEVLVCTVRAMKFHSGQFRVRPGKPLPAEMVTENIPALTAGSVNLQGHIDILKQFGVRVIVAINQFPTDTEAELKQLAELAREYGADDVANVTCFVEGGAGSTRLVAACQKPRQPWKELYTLDMPFEDKLHQLATKVYGADGVDLSPLAQKRWNTLTELGFGRFPLCIAKTQYSLSHDPTLLGRPRGFRLPIRDLRVAAGAGFVYAIAGDILTMPGLPSNPSARNIDIDEQGRIHGVQ
ncbi:MAG: formate--tetrahydrofolate ligase [Planctomycetota bacterium]|nr:formate--tetrahydrofolate ligase [Planctomycetota bacterium]